MIMVTLMSQPGERFPEAQDVLLRQNLGANVVSLVPEAPVVEGVRIARPQRPRPTGAATLAHLPCVVAYGVASLQEAHVGEHVPQQTSDLGICIGKEASKYWRSQAATTCHVPCAQPQAMCHVRNHMPCAVTCHVPCAPPHAICRDIPCAVCRVPCAKPSCNHMPHARQLECSTQTWHATHAKHATQNRCAVMQRVAGSRILQA
jgi:hypothetical protein